MNNDLQHEELIGLLEKLGTVNPTPEATRQALDRVRATLTTTPAQMNAGPPQQGAAIFFSRRLKRLAVAAALLMAIGGLFNWILPPEAAQANFAEVLAALQTPRSVSFQQITRREGIPEQRFRYAIRGDGTYRLDLPNGNYNIYYPDKFIILVVAPKTREATFHEWMNGPSVNLYEHFKNLPNHASARALSVKKIDSKAALGFVVQMDGHDLTVWADATTRLPVRLETEQKDNQGKTTLTMVDDEFVFDKELDAKLFEQPPAGYRLTSLVGAELPAVPVEFQLKDPVVTPLVGVGPIEFGMPRAEVEKLLGKPDTVKSTGPDSYTELNYFGSHGMSIGVSPKGLGVTVITCVGQTVHRVRPFDGKTDKGIRLGASSKEIIKAYGEPDAKGSGTGRLSLHYNQLEAEFTLFGDELKELKEMVFKNPVPKKR